MPELDFSIIIPTYNRSSFVKLAIFSVLRQKKVSLEIIVVDDCSTDDTTKVVRSINDKKIRYIRNNKRLGTSLNFLKCFRNCRGHYIFTLGDDDFILAENTLFQVLKVMKKHKVGIGKIGSFGYEDDPRKPYQALILGNKLIVRKPQNTKEILVKSIDFGLGFFSGVVFDNRRLDKKKLKPDHECYPDHMCNTYHRVAFALIQKYGMLYIPKHFVAAHLSLSLIPRYFDIKKHGRLFIEDAVVLMKEFLQGEELEEYKKAYLRSQLVLLPNIKYFTSYKNYFAVVKRLIEIDKSLLTNVTFMMFVLSGLLPNAIIKVIKSLVVNRSKNSMAAITKKYRYYPKIAKLGL